MLKPGMFLQERYEILDQIGSGGMSEVYRAKCHKLNRLVAIKVLKEEFSQDSNFVSKFKMEAQSAAGLSHPNIVSIYDVVDEDTLHYIVMEVIEGITLKSYIMKKGHLGVKESIGIAIQVAQGVGAAHDQHIIHRDIKPQNMIISKDGKVKVADFGIARAVSSQTVGSTAVGSVHYISPEQARGGYSDARSDIYSLGITIYEMVTGQVPYDGENAVTIALAHLEEPIIPPHCLNPEVTPSLERIILKCTQKKPERRYHDAYELIGDLR
ncbi:MAG: protein kinase, partial [Clostridium sp.]